MYHYPARFQLNRPSGTYTVTFPDFDWGVTQGDDLDDLQDLIDQRKALPAPSKKEQRTSHREPARIGRSESRALRRDARRQAAKRGLRQPVAYVDRLLNLRRRSKMDDIAALAALGKTISIEVRSAA
jgi:predicted RNase H-like HicB family nuclease